MMTEDTWDQPGNAGEDRLPWLEAVEEDDEDGIGLGKLIAGILAALLLIAVVIGGIFWLRSNSGNDGDGAELIAAPEEDYRVAPSEAGGMEVEGEGDAAFAASEGESPEGRIDPGAAPEAPVEGRRIERSEQARRPAAEGDGDGEASARIPATNRRLAESAPQSGSESSSSGSVSASSGRLIQLGAFSSEAAANQAWSQIRGSNSALGSLNRSVTTVQAGGRTLYRLRAAASSPDAARQICATLRSAGQACSVVVN